MTNKDNYKPLGQRFRLIPMPFYAKDGDWSRTSTSTYFARLFFGLILLKAGYAFGTWDAKDELMEKSKVVNFEAEE